MATKTLTITEETYNLLLQKKRKGESFSMEIKRIMTEQSKRPLQEYFGILDEKTGSLMLEDLKKAKKENLSLLKRNLE